MYLSILLVLTESALAAFSALRHSCICMHYDMIYVLLPYIESIWTPYLLSIFVIDRRANHASLLIYCI